MFNRNLGSNGITTRDSFKPGPQRSAHTRRDAYRGGARTEECVSRGDRSLSLVGRTVVRRRGTTAPLRARAHPARDTTRHDGGGGGGGGGGQLPNGHFLLAFTGMSKADAGEFDRGQKRTAYAWEVDADGGSPGANGPIIISSLIIPMTHKDVGTQNGYRVVPWSSVMGESTSAPWDS